MKRLIPFVIFFSCSQGICAKSIREKPIVLVTTSYNNAQWYQKNLDAAFSQKYKNFRIIYVDDCSPDGTGDLVQEYVDLNGWGDRVTLVKNEKRKFKLENFYNAVHDFCLDEEIVIDYDGDDWLAHENVLAKINEAYADPEVWVTYGSYTVWPSERRGFCKGLPASVLSDGSYRHYDWITSHPKSFYVWLFKNIKKEDLQLDGVFFDSATDLAFMFPILEMSGGRIKCINEILYIYNSSNPISVNKVNLKGQAFFDRYIRDLPRYEKFDGLPAK